MTTRHYKCTACQHEFEARQDINDEPVKHYSFCEHEQVIETTEEKE